MSYNGTIDPKELYNYYDKNKSNKVEENKDYSDGFESIKFIGYMEDIK